MAIVAFFELGDDATDLLEVLQDVALDDLLLERALKRSATPLVWGSATKAKRGATPRNPCGHRVRLDIWVFIGLKTKGSALTDPTMHLGRERSGLRQAAGRSHQRKTRGSGSEEQLGGIGKNLRKYP